MQRINRIRFIALFALSCLLANRISPTLASDVLIAVASNFTEPAIEIGEQFKKATGFDASFSFASSGQLYAQVSQGAPFHVFLSADQNRPTRAIEEGLAVIGSQFTYAFGQLVLYSPDPDRVHGESTFDNLFTGRLAIANPTTAPYGSAGLEVLSNMNVLGKLRDRLVRGNNIAQVYQFVETGNVSAGFVALSQVVNHQHGSRWIVPRKLYSPIAQDAVLLESGARNLAAMAFMKYLKTEDAKSVMARYGYTNVP
ncbi:MAG: molybdate ABC transporter substrate-binding protein [marine bacterium B5-7]|nr:MAG: molybdate ABC transporter substrate-binding protein [marine bacterium B5-7]